MIVINNDNSWYTIDGINAEEWLYKTIYEADEEGNPLLDENNMPIQKKIKNSLPKDVKFVVDEGTELGEKILSTPYFKPITNADGELIDIKSIEPPVYEPTVEQQITTLQQKLVDTDYQAIKYVEGWLSDDEYKPIRIQRQDWRNEINKLERELK